MNNTQQYDGYTDRINHMDDIVELIYQHDSMTREEYLNCKAILSNPNFNNHSVHMLNNILGPGYSPATGEVVWTF